MKFVILTGDPEIVDAARKAYPATDTLSIHTDWGQALEDCKGADLFFVDLIRTLDEPNKIAGYESFALAKMEHELAKAVPVVLIAPPEDYELDFMAGWPDFVFAHVRRPIDDKMFRRAATWV